MFQHMDHYGVKVEIEVFIKLKMVEIPGIKYYILTNIQALTRYTWILEIQMFYMLQVIKEEDMFTPMLEVAQDLVCINQLMVV